MKKIILITLLICIYKISNCQYNELRTIITLGKIILADRSYDFHKGNMFFLDGTISDGQIKIERNTVVLKSGNNEREISFKEIKKIQLEGTNDLIYYRKDSTEIYYFEDCQCILRKLVDGDLIVYDNYFVVDEEERESPSNYQRIILNKGAHESIKMKGFNSLSKISNDSLYFNDFSDLMRNSNYDDDFVLKIINVYNHRDNLEKFGWGEIKVYTPNKIYEGYGYIHPYDFNIPKNNSAYIHFYDKNFKILDNTQFDSINLNNTINNVYYYKNGFRYVIGEKWKNNGINYLVSRKYNGKSNYMKKYDLEIDDFIIFEIKDDKNVKTVRKQENLLQMYLREKNAS